MDIKSFYDFIDGSYADAINRFGSDDVLKMFLKKYKNDPSYAKLVEAFNNGDRHECFMAAHAMKGLCGNMAFTAFYKLTSEITEKLRPQDADLTEAELNAISEMQLKITTAIETL